VDEESDEEPTKESDVESNKESDEESDGQTRVWLDRRAITSEQSLRFFTHTPLGSPTVAQAESDITLRSRRPFPNILWVWTRSQRGSGSDRQVRRLQAYWWHIPQDWLTLQKTKLKHEPQIGKLSSLSRWSQPVRQLARVVTIPSRSIWSLNQFWCQWMARLCTMKLLVWRPASRNMLI